MLCCTWASGGNGGRSFDSSAGFAAGAAAAGLAVAAVVWALSGSAAQAARQRGRSQGARNGDTGMSLRIQREKRGFMVYPPNSARRHLPPLTERGLQRQNAKQERYAT